MDKEKKIPLTLPTLDSLIHYSFSEGNEEARVGAYKLPTDGDFHIKDFEKFGREARDSYVNLGLYYIFKNVRGNNDIKLTMEEEDAIITRVVASIGLSFALFEQSRISLVLDEAFQDYENNDLKNVGEFWLRVKFRTDIERTKAGRVSEEENTLIRKLHDAGIGINVLTRISQRDKSTIMKICSQHRKKE